MPWNSVKLDLTCHPRPTSTRGNTAAAAEEWLAGLGEFDPGASST